MPERQVDQQVTEAPERPGAAPATQAEGTHAGILGLQRTIGNRAVARRVLARRGGSATGTTGSKLVGLKTKLSWGDFKGTPGGGTTSHGHPIRAQTKVDGTVSFAGGTPNQITGSAFEKTAGKYSLKNAVTVTVRLDEQGSWKKLSGLNDKQKQLLLEHEQGHYDLTALVTRDMFIELMAEKSKSYDSFSKAGKAVVDIIQRHQALASKITALYDSSGETGHEAWAKGDVKPAAQQKWEGYFQKARTERRQPEVQAPDGVYYKVTLADVLKGAGHKL